MSLTGPEGGSPTRTGSAIGDLFGGLNLTIGILAALNGRSITGKGQRVDISLVDGIVSALETNTMRTLVNGEQPPRMGNRYPSASPYDSFKASDGEFVIGCGNDKLFGLFCTKAIMRPDLLEDPRFTTNALRCVNHAPLKVEIEKWSANYTIEEAVKIILDAGVPAAPIYDIKAVMKDEHIAKVREMFVPCDHPVAGHITINGNPVKLLDSMPKVRTPAPTLGQHNEEVYKNVFGLTDEQYAEIKENGVI